MEKGETVVVANTNAAKCPWGQRASTVPCSLTSVMDEEIAKELQRKENVLAGCTVQEISSSPIDVSLEGKRIVTATMFRSVLICYLNSKS